MYLRSSTRGRYYRDPVVQGGLDRWHKKGFHLKIRPNGISANKIVDHWGFGLRASSRVDVITEPRRCEPVLSRDFRKRTENVFMLFVRLQISLLNFQLEFTHTRGFLSIERGSQNGSKRCRFASTNISYEEMRNSHSISGEISKIFPR